MPLPFEQFQGKGVLGFSSLCSDSFFVSQKKIGEESAYVVGGHGGFPEPTSVLDALESPSPLASSSTTTLSSSYGRTSGGTAADEKCSKMGLEDLDGVLSGSLAQEQSIMRLIMGDIDASSFGVLDPGFGFGSIPVCDNPIPLFSGGSPFEAGCLERSLEEKFQTANREILSDPYPTICSSLPNIPSSPPAKRLNSGHYVSQHDFRQHQMGFSFSDLGHDPFFSRRPQLPPRIAEDGQSAVINQLFNAAELIGTGGESALAQEILARLNHYLNTFGSKTPFHRAALNLTEALHSVILPNTAMSSQNLILRISAFRAFSEVSPFLQFVNFTANQTILESSESFDQIHIIDFDIGCGSQWASLMLELVGRSRTIPTLKITAFASPTTVSDEVELRFAEENLRSFAGEVKIPLEMELLNLELLLNPVHWPLSLRSSEKEAIVVNLPISSVVSGYLPLIMRFLKQISPNVVVCSDTACDRNDAPFPNAVVHALQQCTSLLESLDAANPGPDTAASIERFWVQPSLQMLFTNRQRWTERSPPWRSLFAQCGFSPERLSHTAEAQAECLVQRSPARGFHVEKRQSSSSLALCWQRTGLVSMSAWKC